MARAKKEKVQYVCQSCGFISPRWLGRCSECGAWNSMVEEPVPQKLSHAKRKAATVISPTPLAEIRSEEDERFPCRSEEFKRVLGGGIVRGSLVLIGGDPGIGKSTLLLQEGAWLAEQGIVTLYVSGEESLTQTKMRAQRLALDGKNLLLLAETNLESVLDVVAQHSPQVLIIDSIQTLYTSDLESAPGSISQVRESANRFLQLAKTKNIPVLMIGHVTKEGYLAGPKALEHTVDTLLLFEGDRNHFFRILRAAKNRFGSTNEIGVFEMTEAGLTDVSNPSEMFLAQRSVDAPGSVVVSILEGSRPLLLEVQALVSPSNYGLPQRSATGIDSKRLAMLLAVLEKRDGLRIGTFDVFVNAVGGVRIDETAADLGIATAIASSLRNREIPPNTVIVGEVGLTGEIRPVAHIERRIGEAEKLGFSSAVIPAANMRKLKINTKLKIHPVEKLYQAIQLFIQ